MYIKNLNPEPLQYLNQNRAALVSWITEDDWELAGTFTFKNDVYEAQARRTFRHFWNVIDYKIFKNSAKRHNKHCERACFIEVGAGNENWHYHVATKTPERLTGGFIISASSISIR